jgi:SAM-dependent methyltransferase
MNYKELAKNVLGTIDPLYRAYYQKVNHSKIAIPPLKNRARVGSASIGRFVEAGENIKTTLDQQIKHYLKDQLSQPNFYMLDYGCGVGRVLRAFLDEYSFPIYCTDVDASAISYLQKQVPQSIPACNLFDPPLPYSANFFDCIYSVSIWTHLSLERQITWLQELDRVAKNGALILITTSGFSALAKRRLKDPGWQNITDNDLLEKGIIYQEYGDFSRNSTHYPGISSSYGLTAHSPQYIKQEWSKIFEVIEVQEASIDHIQDLVVMRKITK